MTEFWFWRKLTKFSGSLRWLKRVVGNWWKFTTIHFKFCIVKRILTSIAFILETMSILIIFTNYKNNYVNKNYNNYNKKYKDYRSSFFIIIVTLIYDYYRTEFLPESHLRIEIQVNSQVAFVSFSFHSSLANRFHSGDRQKQSN